VGSAAVIDALRCIGCGRCVAECPHDAIRLVEISHAADAISLSAKKEK
jgi:ferredoxin